VSKLFLYPPGDATAGRLAEHLAALGMSCAHGPGQGQWDVLVRWGTLEGEDRYPFVLNDRRALESVGSETAACLRLHRMRVSARAGTGRQRRGRYRVFVCDLRTVALFRRSRRGYRRVLRRSGRQLEMCQGAARALYLLGLDFGAVDAAPGVRRPFIFAVHPCPPLPSSLVKRFARALADAATDLERAALARRQATGLPSSAVLGADPEFMLASRRTGRMVPASRFFPRYGPVGCDRRTVWTPRPERPLAEIRPRPRSNPQELVEAIRQGLRRALGRASRRRVKAVAGNMPFRGFPTGGHIHFSRRRLSTRLLRALDNYLALPLLMVENSATARRRRYRYGLLGDWRWKPHGFEYRTPGSWLVSRELALGVLSLAKVVADDYDCLPAAPLRDPALARAFYRCDKQVLRPLIPGLWRDLGLAPSYHLYRADIDRLRRLIDSGWEWREREDLRRQWELVRRRRRRR